MGLGFRVLGYTMGFGFRVLRFIMALWYILMYYGTLRKEGILLKNSLGT